MNASAYLLLSYLLRNKKVNLVGPLNRFEGANSKHFSTLRVRVITASDKRDCDDTISAAFFFICGRHCSRRPPPLLPSHRNHPAQLLRLSAAEAPPHD